MHSLTAIYPFWRMIARLASPQARRGVTTPSAGRLFHRVTCSASFRETALATFPNLDRDPNYWRFLQYLIYGTFFDEDTERLVISQAVVAEIERKADKLNNYCAEEFLLRFQSDVMSVETFQWSGYTAEEKARQVTACVFPPAFQHAIDEEWKKLNHDQGRVYFVDGSKFSRAKAHADRHARYVRALAAQAQAQCQEAQDILNYLNNLPSNLFSRVRKYVPNAYAAVDGIEKARARAIQRTLLANIRDNPQPFYSPSGKGDTVRLFGINGGITNLQRNVRKALTVDWHTADIKSSQLAICAALWNVAEVEEFLAKGSSIWQHLYGQMEIAPQDQENAKPALKKALYSTCYGMKEPAIKARLTMAMKVQGIDRKGERFTKSPLIRALLAGREKAMEQIRNKGGAFTCFGKYLDLGELDERKILAQTAQALELKLLHPLFRLANANKDEFTIVLWLHDGFAVHFTRRAEMWKDRINNTINIQIQEMGIHTYLEWE